MKVSTVFIYYAKNAKVISKNYSFEGKAMDRQQLPNILFFLGQIPCSDSLFISDLWQNL